MTRYLIIVCCCIFFLSCTKQNSIVGTGNNIEQPRTTATFKSVHATADIDVIITKGNQFEVILKGYENIIAITETIVENDRLTIRYNTQYSSIRGSNLKAYITMPELNGIGLYGSCTIDVANFLNMTSLNINIHGSGNINLANCKAITTQIGMYGSGNVMAKGLTTDAADVQVHGSGKTQISVVNRLMANIYGSGNIYYWGSPTVSSSVHGSGKILKQ